MVLETLDFLLSLLQLPRYLLLLLLLMGLGFLLLELEHPLFEVLFLIEDFFLFVLFLLNLL